MSVSKYLLDSVLVLEDGHFLLGRGIGHRGQSMGTLCFNTAMSGYEEVLSDPSYRGQIVTFTFPHIGNTGINFDDSESLRPQIEGIVLNSGISDPSSYRSKIPLQKWLEENRVVGISCINTRALTKHIRKTSKPLRGIILNLGTQIDDSLIQQALEEVKNSPSLIGSDFALEFSGKVKEDVEKMISNKNSLMQKNKDTRTLSPTYRVVLLDFGLKHNIIRELEKRNCDIVVLPGQSDLDTIISANPDGVVFSNGPGDPNVVYPIIEKTLQELINSAIPLFGICFGFQLFILAFGGKISKMTVGHHGINHPVKCLRSGKAKITSQNHEFAVENDSLPSCILPTYLSMFDGTLAGMEVAECPIFAVQFHPEASPGPNDTKYLFDDFIGLIRKHAKTL